MMFEKDKKPVTKPVPSSILKPSQPNSGLIGQTGNRPGGTATGSYKDKDGGPAIGKKG